MKRITTLLVGGALMMALATAAEATTLLSLSDGTTTTTITGTLDPVSGLEVAMFAGAFGNFQFNVSTGISSQGGNFIDINSVDYSTAPGTLQIGITDTGFTSDAPGYSFKIGGVTDGTVSYSAYYDLTNAQWGTGTLIGSGSTTAGLIGYSAALPVLPGNSPYSLTEFIDITTGNGLQGTSFNAVLAPVPEPGTMLLLGSGFLALAIYSKRRKNI